MSSVNERFIKKVVIKEKIMRKKEFLKKSEARILIYLTTVQNYKKDGYDMSDKLNIDYIYTMKLLREMYQKGWVKVHKYNDKCFFEVTDSAPMKEAKNILTDQQTRLNIKHDGAARE